MKTIIITLLLSLPLGAMAQQWKAQGKSAEELVPRDWTHTVAEGDLNKDGINDLVILATPNYAEKLMTREDGYTYNFNTPELAIYFGQATGSYACWKTYDNVVPPRPSEYNDIDASIDITPRGVLTITLSHFSSAGGWSNTTETFLYRYQNDDFFLIGMDEDTMARNTGEGEKVSYNYLTHRCQRITYNEFDTSVKPKEKWSRIAKEPLKRMGE